MLSSAVLLCLPSSRTLESFRTPLSPLFFRIIHKPTSILPLFEGVRHKTASFFFFISCPLVGLLGRGCYCFCPASPILASYRVFWIRMWGSALYRFARDFHPLPMKTIFFCLSRFTSVTRVILYHSQYDGNWKLMMVWYIFLIGQWLLFKSNETFIVYSHHYPRPTVLIPFPQCCPSFVAVGTWGC